MTGDQARSATVADELTRAEECLAEARYAIQGGFYRLVRGRAYYAAFHAATAFFASLDKSFRKHSALLAAVDTELVRTGKLPPEFTSLIRGLYQSRLKSDYGDAAPVSKADAKDAIANAENIVSAFRAMLPPS
jgi:uncharacterized protein (UPF0332 family)